MHRRVLILTEYGVLNGGENSLLSVLDVLPPRWRFEAIVPEGSPLAEEFAARGIPGHSLEFRDSQGQRLPQPQIRQRLADRIQQVAPDLIHANSLSMSRLLGPLVCERTAPKLGYLRDILKLSQKAIADLNQLSALVAVSQATADFHCQHGLDPALVHVIHNGVDLDRFGPLPADQREEKRRQRWQLDPEDQVLLFVGQLGMRKGIDLLVPALERLMPEHPCCQLWIVGQRNSGKQEAVEYLERLQQQVAASDWRDRVHWLGRRDDVPELMQCADLLVHPARQEPLGRVLLEACASGLPVVTTSVGGSPEIFEGESLASCLVPSDDPVSLATAIDHWLRSHDERVRMGRELRDLARRRLDVASAAGRLEQLYCQLLEATPSAPGDR